jgi:rare lipoprotein A
MKFLLSLLIALSFTPSLLAFDATYYSDSFEWQGTANGDMFSQNTFSAAICDAPLGGYAYVSTASTGVVVTLNDRPNCKKYPDIIDLSKSAFLPFDTLWTWRVKNVWVQILASGSLPKREIYSENTFMSLGVSLSQKIANTYFTEDGILISGKVIDGGSNVVVFLQQKDTDVPAYSTAFPVVNGNFSVSLKFPKTAGEYTFVLMSSTQVQNGMFSVKDTKSIFLIEPNTFSYPKKNTISFGKSLPKYINPKNTVPYISFGDNIWGVFRIEQDSRITTATGQIFMPDMYLFTPGLANLSLSWTIISTPSSLDQSPISIIWSGSVLLDRVRDTQREWRSKLNLRLLKNAAIFRFLLRQNQKVQSYYYITLPNGDVLKEYFPKKYIDPVTGFLLTNTPISANFTINKWIYKLETVTNEWFAYFNISIPVNVNTLSVIEPFSDEEITKLSANNSVVQRDVLLRINKLRTSLWRALLATDDNLMKIAQIKADYMAENDYVWHALKDNPNIDIGWYVKTKWFTLDPPYGENVAWWNVSHLVLEDGLEESGSHRHSMVDPEWTKIGIGYATKNGKAYLVHVFSE